MRQTGYTNRAEIIGQLPPAARFAFERAASAPRNAASEPTIELYDFIGVDAFSGEGITPKSFAKQLRALGDVPAFTLRVNSPGGSVFDGMAILQLLREHPARVTVKVDGLAASIASVIAQAGATREIAAGGMMMIHQSHGGVFGRAADMEEMAAVLRKIDQQIADVYAARSGRRASEFATLMAGETWFTGAEAVAARLADRVLPEARASSNHRPTRAAIAARLYRVAADQIDVSVTEARRRVAAAGR